MALKPTFKEVKIAKSSFGFYEGHLQEIALLSKKIEVVLVIWTLMWPANVA
jgi:hypothetical protein